MVINDDDTQLQLCPAPDTGPQIFPNFESQIQNPYHNFRLTNYQHQNNPRKKRTKLIRINDNAIGTSSSGVAKPKYAKKPDPSAPKITRPCSECGRKFWSWKALFGHMRCHPERQWRGINPPPNFRTSQLGDNNSSDHFEAKMSEEDHEIAACLLMLANGPIAFETPASATTSTPSQGLLEWDTVVSDHVDTMGGGVGDILHDEIGPSSFANCRFECSVCKKVFGSHQALGGHRASHKNVKGCFAITRNDGGEDDDRDNLGGHIDGQRNNGEGPVIKYNGELDHQTLMALRHKCSVCLRAFSSGQALGGHKRCHWEKVDEPSAALSQGLNLLGTKEGCCLDLNLPAPVEDDSPSSVSCSSSGLTLDLRLGC